MLGLKGSSDPRLPTGYARCGVSVDPDFDGTRCSRHARSHREAKPLPPPRHRRPRRHRGNRVIGVFTPRPAATMRERNQRKALARLCDDLAPRWMRVVRGSLSMSRCLATAGGQPPRAPSRQLGLKKKLSPRRRYRAANHLVSAYLKLTLARRGRSPSAPWRRE